MKDLKMKVFKEIYPIIALQFFLESIVKLGKYQPACTVCLSSCIRSIYWKSDELWKIWFMTLDCLPENGSFQVFSRVMANKASLWFSQTTKKVSAYFLHILKIQHNFMFYVGVMALAFSLMFLFLRWFFSLVP